MRLLLPTILLLLPLQVVLAAGTGWQLQAYKQDKPNELAYYIGVDDDCPTTRPKVLTILKGVFVRSRLKPVNAIKWLISDLYLNVTLHCVKTNASNPVYVVDIRFGNYSGYSPILYGESFGSLGIGPVTSMDQSIKGGLEQAITAYLKANFDLGD